MTHLDRFLNFNSKCPVCDNKLTLFMQVHKPHSTLWKGYKVDNSYLFEQYKFPESKYEGSQIELFKRNSSYHFHMLAGDGVTALNDWHAWQMYFYFICNEHGIQDDYGNKTETILYDACYQRSSPDLQFTLNPESYKWELDYIFPHEIDIVNRDEHFAFKRKQGNLEKVYFLNLDHEQSKTILYYYVTTEEQRAMDNFDPSIFDIELDFVMDRPDLAIANRELLYNKFDSWIVMS